MLLLDDLSTASTAASDIDTVGSDDPVDCIVLAGGKGERLTGIAARYHKPLLVVNGQPLVRNAVTTAQSFPQIRKTFVVVAPENAWPICDVLSDLDATVVVQRNPLGPGHALLEAAALAQAKSVLVLMADNVLTRTDIGLVLDLGAGAAGIRSLPPESAQRFTHWDVDRQCWSEREKTEVAFPPKPDEDGLVACWVGPLLLSRSLCVSVLNAARAEIISGELLIGRYLSLLGVERVTHVDTWDIGTADQWRPNSGF